MPKSQVKRVGLLMPKNPVKTRFFGLRRTKQPRENDDPKIETDPVPDKVLVIVTLPA
jgi:hypothetical protein